MSNMSKTDSNGLEWNERRIIDIFWTGGFDSTFRICQLSRKDVTIRPYYMSDNRASEKYELNAIETIREKLLNNPETKARIEEIIIISKQDRHYNNKVTEAFNCLLRQDFMGSQYEWLGVFALEHVGIELCIHKDDKAIALIKKHGKLKVVNDLYGCYYVIDKANSSADLVKLFGNEHFPIADYTKLEMKKEYISMGLSDIINNTWFCHSPINGKPCGCCNPCRYTIEEGMADRFTPEALRRYKKSGSQIIKIIKKTERRIKKILALLKYGVRK